METRINLQKRPVNYNEPLYFEAYGFLQTEAEFLDNKQWKEWLTLLSQNLSYRMPVRTVPQNREPGSEFSKDMFHFYDNYKTMEMRVKRMFTELAWAEDPASRTRRFITNVRVSLLEDNRLEVKSYILLMRSQLDNPKYQMLSAERRDILEQSESGLKLAKREIFVDQTTLGIENLAVFL